MYGKLSVTNNDLTRSDGLHNLALGALQLAAINHLSSDGQKVCAWQVATAITAAGNGCGMAAASERGLIHSFLCIGTSGVQHGECDVCAHGQRERTDHIHISYCSGDQCWPKCPGLAWPDLAAG